VRSASPRNTTATAPAEVVRSDRDAAGVTRQGSHRLSPQGLTAALEQQNFSRSAAGSGGGPNGSGGDAPVCLTGNSRHISADRTLAVPDAATNTVPHSATTNFTNTAPPNTACTSRDVATLNSQEER
jgi:hypothetical protein